jgi:hypothetical protein
MSDVSKEQISVSKLVLGFIGIAATSAFAFAGKSWADNNQTLVNLVRDTSAITERVKSIDQNMTEMKIDIRRLQDQVVPSVRR